MKQFFSYGDWKAVSEKKDVLRGLTLKVYKFVLRSDRPVGIREVQRALDLSSPTLALYHMNKLEEAGLIKKESNGYTADRVILENLIRFRRILIPRNFFYMIFLVTSLIMLAVFLRPPIITREYVFSLAVISIAAATSVYETVKVFSQEVS
ncbi:MAG: winged helix-turn-helix domain-containing protein [Candidatus Bathyarchaeia archaeon]